MEQTTTTNNFMNDETAKKIQALLEKQELDEKYKLIEKEYLADPVKKTYWESGLGEKLKEKMHKIKDEEWLADMIAVAKEKALRKLEQDEKKKEQTAPMNQNFEQQFINQQTTNTADTGKKYKEIKSMKREELADILQKANPRLTADEALAQATFAVAFGKDIRIETT